jgi:hypothetical protein
MVKRLFKKILTVAIAAACLGFSGRGLSAPIKYYLSPSGNDTWSGLLETTNATGTDGPFATLEMARDTLRNLKQNGKFPADGALVIFRAGNYYRSQTFQLDYRDCGTSNAPIIYCAYTNETATLLGGLPLSGFEPVTNPQVLTRLSEAAKTNVFQVNLAPLGQTNIGVLSRHGFAINWTNGIAELYYNAKPMPLARYPNTGWLAITSTTSNPTNTFYFSGGKPIQWADKSDIWAHGYWAKDWADSCEKVASVDLANGQAALVSPGSQFGFKSGQRFIFENILEELDTPGEYYLDRINNILYFWPPGNLAAGAPFLAFIDRVVWLQNVTNTTFSGITFQGAKLSLLSISGGQSNSVVRCNFRGSARNGVGIWNSPGSGVAGGGVSDTGETGISISGSGNRTNLTSGYNYVLNTTVHEVGRLSRCYYPGIYIYGVGVHVANNLIYNTPHNALLVYGNDHLIEYNEIHHACTETADAGAIYMGQDWTMRGNVFQYNYLHDINQAGFTSDPGSVVGIYLDDCFSGTRIFGNVFCSVDIGVQIGGGRDNTVQNNVFVDSKTCAISADQRLLSWFSGQLTNRQSTLLTALAAVPYQQLPWSARYPTLSNILNDEPAKAKYNVIAENVQYHNGNWLRLFDNAQSVLLVGNNFTSGDPLFNDYPNRGFQLNSNSPAWAIGFQALPLGKIGPTPRPPKIISVR